MTTQEICTTHEAAHLLGVSHATILQWYRTGELTGYKLNPKRRRSHIRIHMSSVRTMLAERK